MDMQLFGLIFCAWVLFLGFIFYNKYRHRYRSGHAGGSPAILAAVDAEGIGTSEYLPPELAPPLRHPESLARPPPQQGLEVVFVTQQGEERPVIFRCRPFGVRFEKRSPISIDSTMVDGPAEAMGIKRGWSVRRVGGEHVEDWSYQQVSQALRAHSAYLPEARAHAFARPDTVHVIEWTPWQIPWRTVRWFRSHVPQLEAALLCWRNTWVSTSSLALLGATLSWFTGAAAESYSHATIIADLEVFSTVHGSLLLLFVCLFALRVSSWLSQRSATQQRVRSFQGCLEDVALLVGSTVGPNRQSPEVYEALHTVHRYLTVLHIIAYDRLQSSGRPTGEIDARHKLLLQKEIEAMERAPKEDGAVLLWITHLLSQLATADVINPGLARELLNTVVSLAGFSSRLGADFEVRAPVSHELLIQLLADSCCLLTPLAIVFSMVSDRRSWLDESPMAHSLDSSADASLTLLGGSLSHVMFCSALGTGFVALLVHGALALHSPAKPDRPPLQSFAALESRAFAFLTQSRPPLLLPHAPSVPLWPGLADRPSLFVKTAGPSVGPAAAPAARLPARPPPPGPVLPAGGASLGEGALRRLEEAGEETLAALRLRAMQVNEQQNSKSQLALATFRGVAYAGSSLRQHLAAFTGPSATAVRSASQSASLSQTEEEGYQQSI